MTRRELKQRLYKLSDELRALKDEKNLTSKETKLLAEAEELVYDVAVWTRYSKETAKQEQ